jgi:hypothetical protein
MVEGLKQAPVVILPGALAHQVPGEPEQGSPLHYKCSVVHPICLTKLLNQDNLICSFFLTVYACTLFGLIAYKYRIWILFFILYVLP